MKLAWLSNTLPDCLFEISQLAQVTEAHFEDKHRDHIKRLNRVVKHAVDNRVSLRIPKLREEPLKIIGFSDATTPTCHRNWDIYASLLMMLIL